MPAQQVISSPADKWGLQAFLHAIRNADEDKGMLSFGTDLMTLGVDMGGNESVDPSCSAVWLPMCDPTDPPAFFSLQPSVVKPGRTLG